MSTKFFKGFGLGIVVLTLLASCDVEKATPNPTYDPDANTITAKFVLNVSTSGGKDTKTTADYAQLNNNFLGMEAVHLLTYNLPYGGTDKFFYTPFNGTGEAVAATRDYDLGALFSAGDISATNQSRVLELALPLESNGVVLYGKAYKDKNTLADDYQGKITTTGDPADLRTLCFGLTDRVSSKEGFEGACFTLSRIITGLTVAGLVNETNFHLTMTPGGEIVAPTGKVDRSFHFWWPNDDVMPGALPAEYKVNSAGYTTDMGGNPIADGTTVVVNNTTYTYHTGQISWKQLGTAYDYSHDNNPVTDPDAALKNLVADASQGLHLSGMLEALGEAYSRLTTIKEGKSDPGLAAADLHELRAGSAAAVLRTMKDLSSIVARVSSTTATLWEDHVAKLLASELNKRLGLYFNGSGESLAFKSIADIKESLQANVSSTDWDEYVDRVNLLTDSYFPNDLGEGGFPINIGLPGGAAYIVCNTQANLRYPDQFEYDRNVPAYGMGEATFDIFNYVYPAELMYFGNSSIRTSDETVSDFPKTLTAWNGDNWNSNGWTFPGQVKSTTRSVAMVYPINYGSAMCKSKVKFKEGVTTLYDNKDALFTGEGNNSIAVGPDVAQGFKVTGFVIGGQPGAVGWDYTIMADPASYDNATYKYNSTTKMFEGITYNTYKFDKMIYDKVTPSFRIADPASSNEIYTICFDNYDPLQAADDQHDVYVALELINDTGKDFWGELNMVRRGGTFYLVGKLDLAALRASGGLDAFDNLSRANYHYPPFDPATGATIQAPRVFMQDYVTNLNLILDANCLQHAYVTVPDLRASQVSLGLSIDISWEPGPAFDVNMGTL